MNTQSILAVGSIALDSLETFAGKRDDILGGSATYFALAAGLWAPVKLVGVVGTDFPAEGRRLFEERKIDLADLQEVEGKTFRWGGKYADDFSSRDTLFTELGVFEQFAPQISAANRSCPIAFNGNIQPDLQLAVCDQMPDDTLIVTDTMNLWIKIAKAGLEEVIVRSDIFLLNDEESEQLTGISDLDEAADNLLARGPHTVIIKQGGAGALLARADRRVQIPVYPDVDVIDPTGAGDSYAGGLVGYIASHGLEQLEEAAIVAAATASYTVAGFGVEQLMTATSESILERAAAIKALMG